MESIVNRIRGIIEDKGLTNASFADRIEIQRPIVSHILSGRNKPSLQVILQILRTFEDIEPNWLLFGKQVASAKRRERESDVSSRPEPKPYPLPGERFANSDFPEVMLLVEGDEFRVVKRGN